MTYNDIKINLHWNSEEWKEGKEAFSLQIITADNKTVKTFYGVNIDVLMHSVVPLYRCNYLHLYTLTQEKICTKSSKYLQNAQRVQFVGYY